MSEAPPDEEDEEPPPPGSVQKLVGRRCRQVVEDRGWVLCPGARKTRICLPRSKYVDGWRTVWKEAEGGCAWIGGFLELVDGCHRRWVPDGDAEKTSRVAMTTKFPSTLILMELAEELSAKSCELQLQWIRRDLNQLADDLTNQNFASFDPNFRIDLKGEVLEWWLLGRLLAHATSYFERSMVAFRLRKDSSSEVLIEGFDEWRRDHADRSRRLDLLAPLLMSHNISVYRLDFGQNECPPDVLRSISAGYSGYFFVHPHARFCHAALKQSKEVEQVDVVVRGVHGEQVALLQLPAAKATIMDAKDRQQLLLSCSEDVPGDHEELAFLKGADSPFLELCYVRLSFDEAESAKRGEVKHRRQCLIARACPDHRSEEDGRTALLSAALQGHLEVAKQLCRAGRDLSDSPSQTETITAKAPSLIQKKPMALRRCFFASNNSLQLQCRADWRPDGETPASKV
ncbi:hypothetical protein AK812_SmicGene40995 [Symbiodinium microadriaticum]|uniref:Uncharacterized protein n=1 Tax=Symbiodinium microadriaticum TaxID=2951 RepID=A0A1Q9C7A4_SYMMI|nr:hypothetical protein AK812_SmicGene40995 [Symbiodinium microadriaticum]